MSFDPQANEDVFGGEFTPISNGWHQFYITQAELTTSKKGNEMIALRYTVIGEDEHAKKHTRDWIVLTQTKFGFGKLAKLCRAIDPDMKGTGADPEDGFDPFSQKSINYHLLGQPFGGKVKQESRKWMQDDGTEETRIAERVQDFRLIDNNGLKKLEAQYGGDPTPPLPDDAHGDSYGGGYSGGVASTSGVDDDIPF